ncbi:MAG: sporulation protein YqfC [Clostridia bacterium]|nr:sporulation protein YqfC [Clostridia bacterium]
MSIKEKLTENMQLPKEIILNYPKLTVLGKKDITVENIIGVIEFDEDIVRLNTETHILNIYGLNLEIKSLSLDEVQIQGKIEKIIFE